MEVFDRENLGGIPYALRQCERMSLNVSLELELRASLEEQRVRELKEAIQKNDRITTVKFNLHGQWEEIPPLNRQAVAALVNAVERLPNLTELVIAGDFAPIPAITSLLLCATRLKTMRLEQFRNLKSCDTQVLKALCDAVRAHRSLQNLTLQPRIASSSSARCEPQEEYLIRLLVEALADGPALVYCNLETNVHVLTGPSVVQLCRSRSLTKLELCPRGEVGVDVLEALAVNSHLKELVVTCTFSEQSTAAVTQLLHTNTSLSTLTLISNSSTTINQASHTEAIDASLLLIAEALRTNTTLSHMTVPSGNPLPTIRTLQAFVSVFETNFTLHTLEVFHDMTKIQRICFEEIDRIKDETAKTALMLGKRIEYYTLLNRSGRGDLLGNATVHRDQWVDKLVEFSYSVDRLYFFLRTNPTLCSIDTREVDPRQSTISPKSAARKRGRVYS
ncbi:expressed unknown protein [Seminavis robusta]|uniref:Uncharacterized protein n=1 Tax=Seminavis robusta TaxID=568900 RepID=A0A9N8EKP3_9STRA|nr:expressed unknown protein [Seminavis robusta]|eukprot:Sro1308_g261410.1 n/a (448) ;mRNA; r:5008-6351